MSSIKAKEGADLVEGIRLGFNSRMWANLYKGKNGEQYLIPKLDAEAAFDNWLIKNLDGLPEKQVEEKEK